MLVSMTGYGRALFETKSGLLEIEMHSVNRKALDINIQIPRELLYLDVDIRHFISESIERGQVTVRLGARTSSRVPKLEEMRRVKEEWESLAEGLGLHEEMSLAFLASQTSYDILAQDMSFEELRPGLHQAMEGLLKMKRAEGALLEKEFLKGLQEIEHKVNEMGPLVPVSVERHRQKLMQRVSELELKGEPDRIAFEVALFADRLDIAEEMTRLLSHVKQFRTGLAKKAAGRELNFLLQEMLREATTTLSKSQDIDLTRIGLEIKGIIEKMKEQVANIE